MQTVLNGTGLTPVQVPQVATQLNPDEPYYIKLEMVDGTSQLVRLSLEQALGLGLQCPPLVPKEIKKLPTTTLNYKVVHPSDLNLCTSEPPKTPPLPAPRGRPKKRPRILNDKVSAEASPIINKAKVLKTARTRSGRITRPPVHMEREFEKIVTDVNSKTCKDLNTVQFEPLKTTNTEFKEQAPLVSLEMNYKKRKIPPRFRCGLCKKAYLGRNRMVQHFKKHPDHRTENQPNMEDCETWNCLVETAMRANKGQRGAKFCKEITNLIRNARLLVKYFFKPIQGTSQCEYTVKSLLAEVLKIDEGDYRFNENELCKDVTIFEYLFFNDDTFGNTTFADLPQQDNQLVFEDEAADGAPVHTETINDNVEKRLMDLHFNSNLLPTTNSHIAESIEKKTELYVDGNKELKNDFMNIFGEPFTEQAKSNETHDKAEDFSNFYIEHKELTTCEKKPFEPHERNGKEVDIFRNTINNILNYGASDEHMSTLLDKEKKQRKSDEFDLNKLHLDELILPDAPVNTILDSSTGSDDIMNVDQFVNERFKKLTETENGENVGMPNPNLMELPALECFHFNS